MKRSCRRTNEENRIHDQAVKLRKMTDEQLIRYVEDREQVARYEAEQKAIRDAEKSGSVKDFLEHISQQKVPGIGIVTVNKLMKVAKEHEFI